MSPVSVHEDSETLSSDSEDRWYRPSSNDVDCSVRAGKVRSGMLEGRRDDVGGGILGCDGAVKQQLPSAKE
jgi:hypothetical protein